MAQAKLEAEIRACEEKLLHTDMRKHPEIAEALLAPGFEEASAAGVTSRAQVIRWLLLKAPEQRWELQDFRIRILTKDVILAHYRAHKAGHPQLATLDTQGQQGAYEQGDLNDAPLPEREGGAGKRVTSSLRTSVWRRDAGQWQMVFHQVTRLATQ